MWAGSVDESRCVSPSESTLDPQGVPELKLLNTIMASQLPAGEAHAYPDSCLTSTKSGCTGAGAAAPPRRAL